MSENLSPSDTSGADVSAYENLDLSQLNQPQDTEKPGEKKLEDFLVKTIFFAKIATWIGIGLVIIVGLYGYTRNQTQDSWLMSLPMNTREGALCTWMNHGNLEILRRDSAFLEYLASEKHQDLVDLENSGKCMAPDTIKEWLELQSKYSQKELADAYGQIIPKKFLGVTIDASPELSIIAKNAPRNRVDHADVMAIVSNAVEKISNGSATVSCSSVRFVDLDAEVGCRVQAKPPVQPRKVAIEFMQELEKSGTLLVSYPNTLDMSVDKNTQELTTEFVATLTYIPARYEADTLQKITYDKR